MTLVLASTSRHESALPADAPAVHMGTAAAAMVMTDLDGSRRAGRCAC